jgi:hypothetical protein
MQQFLAQFKLRPMMAFHLEQLVFRMADKMVQGYTGGQWDDAKLGKLKIISIPATGEVTLNNPMSGQSITTDSVTASAAFLHVVVTGFWNMHSDKMTEKENEALGKFYDNMRAAVYGRNSHGVNVDHFYSFTD